MVPAWHRFGDEFPVLSIICLNSNAEQVIFIGRPLPAPRHENCERVMAYGYGKGTDRGVDRFPSESIEP